MTVDLFDLAEVLRRVFILVALFWIAYAWLHRIEYRRAVLFLAVLLVIDFLAHAFAGWAEQPDSPIPSEFNIYSLYLVLGTAVGLAAAFVFARRDRSITRFGQVQALPLQDAALIVVIAGGIGARAYHVLTHWDYYAQNADDITTLGAQGGMGMRGALAAGIVALLLFAFIRRVSGAEALCSRKMNGWHAGSLFWKLADAGAVGLALAQSIGWYGAHLIGANYGVVSDASFAQDLPDLYGIVALRVPVQLITSGFFLLLFIVLLRLGWRRTNAPGLLFLLYLITSGLGGFLLGYWRADETLIWNGLRADQWVDAAFAMIGLIVLAIRFTIPRVRALSPSPYSASERRGV